MRDCESQHHNSSKFFQEALKLLQELELQIPNESLLYFSIGQVYKKLGEPHLELMNLAWAMDLDPKGSSSLIKQAIEKNFLPRDKELNNTMGRIGENFVSYDVKTHCQIVVALRYAILFVYVLVNLYCESLSAEKVPCSKTCFGKISSIRKCPHSFQ